MEGRGLRGARTGSRKDRAKGLWDSGLLRGIWKARLGTVPSPCLLGLGVLTKQSLNLFRPREPSNEPVSQPSMWLCPAAQPGLLSAFKLAWSAAFKDLQAGTQALMNKAGTHIQCSINSVYARHRSSLILCVWGVSLTTGSLKLVGMQQRWGSSRLGSAPGGVHCPHATQGALPL